MIAVSGLVIWVSGIQFKTLDFKTMEPFSILLLAAIYIVFVLSMFFILFYLTKLTIENIEYRERTFEFGGGFGEYLGIFFLGLFLTIITLGIYSPWFIRNMQRFYVDNSSYNESKLAFKGKGGELFIILLVTFVIPYTFIMVLTMLLTMSNNFEQSQATSGIIQLITTFVLIPYMYFVYKWMVNIEYKGYKIRWNTDSWEACGKIFVQVLFSVITFGIYYPMAIVKLYKYFAEHTIAVSETGSKKFGYDLEPGKDFLFLWGQVLLIIVTLGIYYPWAFCKITNRVLGKSFSEEIENV
jgi:uncharacterized membrane protein YjgN (DUF898 family)